MLTVGVEEEFLLLEQDGTAAPVAPRVLRYARGDGRIGPEYWSHQVETATRVCTSLAELRADLVGLRLHAAESAQRAGALLVATGRPPFGGTGPAPGRSRGRDAGGPTGIGTGRVAAPAGPPDPLTDDARYRELARRFPDATALGASCACHVHVGVPDRDLAVEVLARLRPWLPALLALTVNSPFSGGGESGWSSTRYHALLRWPTFRPPERWAGADRYDQAVRSLIARGAAMDPGSVYFLARLSARYPTVEVRVADVGLTAQDAVVFAGVVRALVASLIEDAGRRAPITPVTRTGVRARLLLAARHGLSWRGTPRLGGLAGQDLVGRLLAKITPALAASGDTDEVRAGLARLARVGTGADRQRELWRRTGTRHGFVAALADETVSTTADDRQVVAAA